MNQPIKFPDMRPSKPMGDIPIPPPSGFAQRVPLFPTTDAVATNRRFERRRLVVWFGVAVALHAALLLGIWLMPPLRIKWEPSPDAWVQVTSVPKEPPAPQTIGVAPVPQPGTAKTAAAPPPRSTPAAVNPASAPKPKTPVPDSEAPVSLLP